MDQPLLSVSLITYNQAKFIRQCLDGIVMQRTNFPIEILVHDDASTDGTQDIIKEYAAQYPGLINPILQTENQYSKGVKIDMEFNYRRARGKYIATCEGDDFWTDPDKLQRQVDILEKHPHYSMCCHACAILEEETQKLTQPKPLCAGAPGMEFDYARKRELGWFFHTLSVVFRNGLLDPGQWKEFGYYRDVHQFYYLLKHGKGYYLEDVMGTYREHAGGVYRGMDREKQIQTDLRVFDELYAREKDPLLKHEMEEQLKELAFLCLRHRKAGAFFSYTRTLHPHPTCSMYLATAGQLASYYLKKITGKKGVNNEQKEYQ